MDKLRPRRRAAIPERRRGGNTTDQAIWAAERGWAVLEVVPGKKIPARPWKDLGYRSPSQLQGGRDGLGWRGRYDVGIMTGPSRLVDVESDGPHGRQLLEAHCSGFPATVLELVTDKGSIHWVFKSDGKKYKTFSGWQRDDCSPTCQLDVRAEGGYFLLFATDRRVTSYE